LSPILNRSGANGVRSRTKFGVSSGPQTLVPLPVVVDVCDDVCVIKKKMRTKREKKERKEKKKEKREKKIKKKKEFHDETS